MRTAKRPMRTNQKTHSLMVRMQPEQRAKLDEVGQAQYMTAAEIVRVAVAQYCHEFDQAQLDLETKKTLADFKAQSAADQLAGYNQAMAKEATG